MPRGGRSAAFEKREESGKKKHTSGQNVKANCVEVLPRKVSEAIALNAPQSVSQEVATLATGNRSGATVHAASWWEDVNSGTI